VLFTACSGLYRSKWLFGLMKLWIWAPFMMVTSSCCAQVLHDLHKLNTSTTHALALVAVVQLVPSTEEKPWTACTHCEV
jgi:hypothetical protein